MSGCSDYLQDALMDHVFGKAVYVVPTIYLALSTADPGGSGAGMAEPAGGGYARVETEPADWTSSSGGIIENADDITFPAPTADWGICTYFALFDAASGGNMLAYGALETPQNITSGAPAPTFLAGNLAGRLMRAA